MFMYMAGYENEEKFDREVAKDMTVRGRLGTINCPTLLALKEAERPAATLDCLQQLHPVSLDGKPVAMLQYDLSSDPRTDRPALLAMIDVRSLAPGRHELLVARPPVTEKQEASGDDTPYRIPFWR